LGGLYDASLTPATGLGAVVSAPSLGDGAPPLSLRAKSPLHLPKTVVPGPAAVLARSAKADSAAAGGLGFFETLWAGVLLVAMGLVLLALIGQVLSLLEILFDGAVWLMRKMGWIEKKK
jgi:hypothetical protein